MKPAPLLRRFAGFSALLALLLAPGAAQTLLYTKHDGKMLLVRRAKGDQPFAEVDGRIVSVSAKSFSLAKTEEFLPVLISVSNIDVQNNYHQVDLAQRHTEFAFRATFESDYQLDNVFLVVELESVSSNRMLYLQGLDRLDPHVPQKISVSVPLTGELKSAAYTLHLFIDGREALNSLMPAAEREAALDRMIAKRVTGAKDGPPRLFSAPPPEYPAALRSSGATGDVMLGIRVGADGRVYDPVVKSASAPAFGEAALAAVKAWRFLPAVKEGRPVETKVDLPLDLPPPAKAAK